MSHLSNLLHVAPVILAPRYWFHRKKVTMWSVLQVPTHQKLRTPSSSYCTALKRGLLTRVLNYDATFLSLLMVATSPSMATLSSGQGVIYTIALNDTHRPGSNSICQTPFESNKIQSFWWNDWCCPG